LISTLTGADEAKPTQLDLSVTQVSGGGEVGEGSLTLEPAEHAVLTFAGVAQEPETERGCSCA
jgi:hypothetical protein